MVSNSVVKSLHVYVPTVSMQVQSQYRADCLVCLRNRIYVEYVNRNLRCHKPKSRAEL